MSAAKLFLAYLRLPTPDQQDFDSLQRESASQRTALRTAQQELSGQCEAISSEMSEPRIRKGGPGRKIDPNSAFQKVSRALIDILKDGTVKQSTAIYMDLVKRTGLPLAKCKNNANQVKGIKRDYGSWRLLKLGELKAA
jgi:hypothetical protein